MESEPGEAEREARQLIETIAREHTLNGTIFGTSLSNQLYEKSTHFLLELIQNADDNIYRCPTPTLSFSYRPGFLRIDCNEIGFDASNVKAICGISQSTKSGKTSDGEFIGEKGIGFKSVFKAADVVSIVSNEFTFKFDRTKPLGVITPIWDNFPETTRSDFTSISLQLSATYNEKNLVKELLNFDANLLIFLRRVEEINIRVESVHEQVLSKQIRKTQQLRGSDRLVVLQAGAETLKYLVRTHVIKDLPKESKRPDWSQTKIVLAFPLPESSDKPLLKPQNVYAFLPIRNYGFKFLIQADFLLTASREDIESILPWNQKIRDALAEVFMESMFHFNQGPLKYVWPYYLPSISIAISSFFQPAIETVLCRLAESPVFESCGGNMVKPSTLVHVPTDLCATSVPFTIGSLTKERCLSSNYPSWVIEAMTSVGVTELSPRGFLEDLRSLIANDTQEFQMKPAEWHSQLAKALLKLSTDAELMPIIQHMCIIPLNDGTWTAAKDRTIFLAKGDASPEIPSGISALIVDAAAESDPYRRTLFTSLGVKAWEAPEICRLILKVHESPDFEPEKLKISQIVSHAVFLYQAAWQPPKGANLWFATAKNERCRGREMYISGSLGSDSAVGRVFSQLEKRFPVMHNEYLAVMASELDWPDWLIQNSGLSRIPRLVSPYVEPRSQPTYNAEAPQIHAQNDALENSLVPVADELELINCTLIDLPDPTTLDSDWYTWGTAKKKNMLDVPGWTKSSNYKSKKKKKGSGTDNSNTLNAAAPPIEPHVGVVDSEASLKKDALDSRAQFLDNQNDLKIAPQVGERAVNSDSGYDFYLRDYDADSRDEGGNDCAWDDDLGAAFPVQKKKKNANSNVTTTPNKEPVFSLSDEFLFMLHECNSADVLQLLRENWHHYSQWVEGAHMKWQSDDFVAASTQLKNKIGASLVRTKRGSLPLNETVLEMLDAQLDLGRTVPAVEIQEPQHPEWNFLSYFGVLVKADIYYYLCCLVAFSRDTHPDIDTATYIYEQIQSKYTGNEELIRFAFYNWDVVLVPPEPQSPHEVAVWTRMEDSLSKEIDVESKYPSCSYLFRCLVSPSGDPIGGLVHTMTLINTSSKLDDISRLFREVSKSLKDVITSKAALLLKPIHEKAIFPVKDGPGKHEYDRLSHMHDQSWFVVDQASFVQSFTGVLPLLSIPFQDLPAMEDLFRVLRVEVRKLSKLATSQTLAQGETRTNFHHTNSFRSKSPFIKALIPTTHPHEALVKRQISDAQVRISTAVYQMFTVNLFGKEKQGNPIPGHVSISTTDNELTLVMTEESAMAECPPHELVSLIADICLLKEQKHFSLLYTALSNLSLKSINSAFLQQGYHVEGLILDEPRATPQYQTQRIYAMRMPSLFSEKLMGMGGSTGAALPDGLVYGSHGRGGVNNLHSKQDHDQDRRLPMLHRIQGTVSAYSNIPLGELVPRNREFIGWDHIQYLGEKMISKLLHIYLGQTFVAERDWTSDLRSRSGHSSFSDISVAPFTLKDHEIVGRMTEFVIKYGSSRVPNWQHKLRSSLPAYHVDVAVNVGDTGSAFTILTRQLERMRNLKMSTSNDAAIKDVAVLILIGKVYSESEFSFNIFVDPWYLVDDGILTLGEKWLLTAYMNEDGLAHINDEQQLATTEDVKQQVPSLYLPWVLSETTGILQHRSNVLHTTGRREVYRYNALPPDHIRLLYLLPGDREESLHAVLNHIPCSSAGSYMALSYVWGSDQRSEELVIPDGVIPITLSLSKALKALRQSDQAVMVWADAVCINQADNEEKAQQIRLMPQIFQACEITYAFLDGGLEADAALEMLMQVRSKAVLEEQGRTKEDAYDWPQGLSRIPASWNGAQIPPFHKTIWASVKALFALPYFRRVWIIQEVVAAPAVKIVCGKWLIDWKDLFLALQTVDREIQVSDQDVAELRSSWEPFLSLAVQREWEAKQYRWSLLMLLEHFRYAQSTLSRDRLFALVGLASDGDEAEFEPDYNITFGQVILKFSRVFVRQGRGLQLIYRAGISAQSDKFPSWIPDWTIKRPVGLHDSSDTGVTFSACGPQAPNIECGPEPDELSVEGYEMDVIDKISAASNVEQQWGQYFEEVEQMIESAVLSSAMGPREDLKWKVPVASAIIPRAAGSGAMDMKKSYGAFRKWINAPKQVTSQSRNYRMSYVACLRGTLEGWRFVVTKRGLVGIVPNLTNIGDMVAIMKGGCVPFLLRESGNRPGALRLVGECYIHGIMKGEGLGLPGVVERVFRLH